MSRNVKNEMRPTKWGPTPGPHKIDDQFRVMAFRNPIVEGASVSGFIFTNRDEGTKVVDIDLISYGKANNLDSGNTFLWD